LQALEGDGLGGSAGSPGEEAGEEDERNERGCGDPLPGELAEGCGGIGGRFRGSLGWVEVFWMLVRVWVQVGLEVGGLLAAGEKLGDVVSQGKCDLKCAVMAVGVVDFAEFFAECAGSDADDGVDAGVEGGGFASESLDGDGVLADVAGIAVKVFCADEGEEADEVGGAGDFRMLEDPGELVFLSGEDLFGRHGCGLSGLLSIGKLFRTDNR
jgi:hypothetical protein